VADHLAGGNVHWENRDSCESKRDAAAHHQGQGYAPEIRRAPLKT